METAQLIRIQQKPGINTGWYEAVYKINGTEFTGGMYSQNELIQKLGLTQGQLLDVMGYFEYMKMQKG